MGYGKRVIVVSNAIGRRMIDEFGVPQDRIRLIPRGVDLSQFHFSLKRFDEKPRKFRIIHVGRFSPNKGQVEFLKAIHLLRSRLPNFEVWLVGAENRGRTQYTKLIRKTIQQFALESCVQLPGPSRDVPGLLAQSDLLVLSSTLPEPFGRVIIEAGAVGTPVAATWLGGVTDIIDHGVNGFLFPPKSVTAMAEAMYEMLTDRAKAREYATALRKKIEEKFALGQMVRKTVEVYQEVRKKKKILVIKLGAMGDLVLVVPSLRMLKERYPDASITLLVDKRLSRIMADCPYLDDMILVDRKKFPNPLYLLKTARRVRRENFDVSVDLHNNKYTYLLAYLGGAIRRYGFARGFWGSLLNRPDKTFRIAAEPVRHQFRVISKAGVQDYDDTLELWPGKEQVEKAERVLLSLDLKADTKVIGFVMGSSPKWPTKRWPAAHYRKLAERIFDRYDARILLFGSPGEAELANEFRDFDPDRVVNLIGKTGIEDLPAFFQKLHFVVSGDTALLHVAAAMHVPIAAIFGPTDPKRHVPPAKKIAVFMRNLPCQPCYSGVCKEKETMGCLAHISVDEVFDTAKRFLEA